MPLHRAILQRSLFHSSIFDVRTLKRHKCRAPSRSSYNFLSGPGCGLESRLESPRSAHLVVHFVAHFIDRKIRNSTKWGDKVSDEVGETSPSLASFTNP